MKKQNGITLIALVITIILLLILAGVSVRILTEENRNIGKSGKISNNFGSRFCKRRITI